MFTLLRAILVIAVLVYCSPLRTPDANDRGVREGAGRGAAATERLWAELPESVRREILRGILAKAERATSAPREPASTPPRPPASR